MALSVVKCRLAGHGNLSGEKITVGPAEAMIRPAGLGMVHVYEKKGHTWSMGSRYRHESAVWKWRKIIVDLKIVMEGGKVRQD